MIVIVFLFSLKNIIRDTRMVFQAIWASVFEPGPNATVVNVMNGSFVALFCLLGALAYVTRNIHVFALLGVAIALCVSIQWYAPLIKMYC